MRALGAFAVTGFIFFAVIAATSRLLQVKEVPGTIYDLSNGIANLFKGVFAR